MFFKEKPFLEKQEAFSPIKLDIHGDRFRRGVAMSTEHLQMSPHKH